MSPKRTQLKKEQQDDDEYTDHSYSHSDEDQAALRAPKQKGETSKKPAQPLPTMPAGHKSGKDRGQKLPTPIGAKRPANRTRSTRRHRL
jgi:hypothetical protein